MLFSRHHLWPHVSTTKNMSNFLRKGRLYPAYSLSGSEGEESPRRTQNNHTYQHPVYQQPAGLSDTPTSEENASDATLTDSELALARDSTLLVHNGKSYWYPYYYSELTKKT
ncbi:hypothetical protein HHI36_010226 [Cryptolaemus montrouzieri]|uniref:Uncharacterized protein n=1 Tax=Cryptolaemus montrouzieri TaxID=559131 RepID=A0ABD2MI36_9CUCU